jgi:ABC-type phosphate transport system auxiliary subunit
MPHSQWPLQTLQLQNEASTTGAEAVVGQIAEAEAQAVTLLCQAIRM